MKKCKSDRLLWIQINQPLEYEHTHRGRLNEIYYSNGK